MSHFAMPVSEFMTSNVETAAAEESLQSLESKLVDRNISSVAIVDRDWALVGVVSRTDLLRAGRREAGSRGKSAVLTLPNKTAADIMTKTVETVSENSSIADATNKMVADRIHRIFVTDGNNKPVGVVSPRDVMRAIAAVRLNKPIKEFMSSPLFTVRHNEPLSLATERLEKAHVTGLIVVEDDYPVGLFTQREALGWKDEPRETPVEEVMSNAFLSLGYGTPLHRAAAQAAEMRVRRVIAMHDAKPVGILTGMDFAKAAH